MGMSDDLAKLVDSFERAGGLGPAIVVIHPVNFGWVLGAGWTGQIFADPDMHRDRVLLCSASDVRDMLQPNDR